MHFSRHLECESVSGAFALVLIHRQSCVQKFVVFVALFTEKGWKKPKTFEHCEVLLLILFTR